MKDSKQVHLRNGLDLDEPPAPLLLMVKRGFTDLEIYHSY